jgi:hypothetical protein
LRKATRSRSLKTYRRMFHLLLHYTTNFDHGDRNLEKAVEDLSQLLEEPIEADTVKDLRKRMMDKTVRLGCTTNLTYRC